MSRWRKPGIVLTALLLLTGTPDRVRAETSWPEFRGPHGDGTADDAKAPLEWSETKNVAWKTPIWGKAWSSPVILDGQVWLTTAPEDGKTMHGICVDQKSGAIVRDLKLFDVAEPQFVHALNGHASPTPAIEPGRVYLHFGAYGTACVDTKTFATIWSRNDLPCNHHRGPGSSPIIHGNLLYLTFDGFDYQYVAALDKQTGKTVWRAEREIDYGTTDGDIMKAYNTPTVIKTGGREQLITPTSKAVLSLDPATGKEIWRVRYQGFSSTARTLYKDGLLYVSSGFGPNGLYAIRPDGQGDVTDTHVVWSARKTIPQKPSPLYHNGLLYLIHDTGVALCMDGKTGDVIWTKRITGQYSASPILVAGRIYLFDQDGMTTVIEPGREYKELARNKLDAGFMASPAVVDGSLYLRTTKALYRIDP